MSKFSFRTITNFYLLVMFELILIWKFLKNVGLKFEKTRSGHLCMLAGRA